MLIVYKFTVYNNSISKIFIFEGGTFTRKNTFAINEYNLFVVEENAPNDDEFVSTGVVKKIVNLPVFLDGVQTSKLYTK